MRKVRLRLLQPAPLNPDTQTLWHCFASLPQLKRLECSRAVYLGDTFYQPGFALPSSTTQLQSSPDDPALAIPAMGDHGSSQQPDGFSSLDALEVSGVVEVLPPCASHPRSAAWLSRFHHLAIYGTLLTDNLRSLEAAIGITTLTLEEPGKEEDPVIVLAGVLADGLFPKLAWLTAPSCYFGSGGSARALDGVCTRRNIRMVHARLREQPVVASPSTRQIAGWTYDYAGPPLLRFSTNAGRSSFERIFR